MGLCLVVATVTVTTYEAHRTTVNLGNLTTITPGSVCPSPPHREVARLRSTYTAELPRGATDAPSVPESVVVVGDSTACTLLRGLQAVGPSYGMQFENGALIGCGVVSGQLAPAFSGGIDFTAYTKRCQGEANKAETLATERYRPRLIVWGSTEEHRSIVADTGSGSQVLTAGTPAWSAVMLQRMNDRVEQFIGTGAKVILLLEPPASHADGLNETDLNYEQMNAVLRKVAAEHPRDVATVNLQTRVCPSGPPCPYVVDGMGANGNAAQAVRPDGIHYLDAGALWVAKWLLPQIVSSSKNLSA
jgi:hypothetical protein